MNALNVTSLKVVACGTAALMLTALATWSFAESTAVARGPLAGTAASMVVQHASAHVAKAAVSVLLD